MNAIILSAVLGVVMMYAGLVAKTTGAVRTTAITGLLLLLVANTCELYGIQFFHINTRNMLAFTSFGLLFNSIAFGSTLLYFLLSSRDITQVGNNPGEYFALIFFVLTGVALCSSYNNLLMLFIGIEILSIPLYILTGSDKRDLRSNEASLKYFLMGTFSTGIMLMGIALIYGAWGTFDLAGMGNIKDPELNPLLLSGMLLLLIAMSFKISAAPFHFWTPDVYDGAPSV